MHRTTFILINVRACPASGEITAPAAPSSQTAKTPSRGHSQESESGMPGNCKHELVQFQAELVATCSNAMQKTKTPPEVHVAALLKTPEAHMIVKTRSTKGTSIFT